jgi:hypothetical protein
VNAPAPRRRAGSWTTSPALSYGARAVLWDIAAQGPGYRVTPARLADRAARDRPAGPETAEQLAAWLDELAGAGALSVHRGVYAVAADRELDVAASRIAGAHLGDCRPPLPRPEAARHWDLIRELILAGRDPADVEAALARWRDRRAGGCTLGLGLLTDILAGIERAAERLAVRDDADVALHCGTCEGWHRPGAPCLGLVAR